MQYSGKMKPLMKMAKSSYLVVCLVLLTGPQILGQDEGGLPEEDQNFLYVSPNILTFKHTISVGYWNSIKHRGMNTTLSFYHDLDVTYPGFDGFPPTVEEGPSFYALAMSYRFKYEPDKAAFAGIGFSMNKLVRNYLNYYPMEPIFPDIIAHPRPHKGNYDNRYATLLIENGYIASSKNFPFVISAVLAWNPLVVETWRQNGSNQSKGYFTPANLQLRLELGLKWIRPKKTPG